MKNLIIVSRYSEFFARCFYQHEQLQQHFTLLGANNPPRLAHLKQAEVMLGDPNVVSEYLLSAPNLKWVQSTWAGNNKLQNIGKHDYLLSGVKGIFDVQMFEYVMSYILYFTRRIEAFNELKEKQQWSQLICKTLSEYSVGIMGMGSIGSQVAVKLGAMGMTINSYSRSNKHIPNVTSYTHDNLAVFLQNSDFVINLLPETDLTRGFCDANFFTLMKQDSVFINAGRGSVIKQDQDMVNALNKGLLRGAVLDVFEQEPLPSTHVYYTTPNLYITCHTAAISNPQKVFDLFAKNAMHYIQQEPLLYLHDFKRGY